MAAINLPFAASATKRAPNADELANGFPCGDADKQLFDWLEWWLTGQIATAITEGGLTVDSALLPRLAQAIQSGKSTYAVATGTANAWVVAPSLAVPAYAAGRVLNVIAPATNTSTTVNADISGLGNRRVKKSDGSDPAVGDLVAGRVYATIDDGTNIRILTPLPSDAVAAVAAAAPVGGNWIWSQNLANNVITTLTGSAYGGEGAANLGDSTFSGGILTFGAQTAGLWLISFSGVSVSATTDLFLSNIFNNSGSLGAATAQTSQSAPSGTAITVKRFVAGDNMRFTARQIVGASQVISGRLNAVRLGA
ncbi:hypothetical protein SAMN05660750_03312 [Bosea thiooxidans]|uniref:Uncharacterized protein n=1 Tax=Bosea thiooxidans TaxID=53254 RepID=A0A1T5FKU3_9HYPH|nr:hypothetical protein [Bosea thiooxidans]SKB96765.1 hypothetical protein SAMN05660750_03312 [Bosea thiooxidans]